MSNWQEEYYPNGAEYEEQDLGWGLCLDCNSGLHNLGAEYDPEDMQSYELIVCPNCQLVARKHNRKWHAPDGTTFDIADRETYILHMDAIGEELPSTLQEDLAWEGRDADDDLPDFDTEVDAQRAEFDVLIAEMSDDDLRYRGQL